MRSYSQASSPPLTPPPHDAAESPIDLSTLSIYDVCRLHPRQRLIVQPLHWTARQLGLLGCEFSHQSCSEQPSSSPPLSPKQISTDLLDAVVTLARGACPAKEVALAAILGLASIKQAGHRLFFCHGREGKHIRMPCAVFSCRPSSSFASLDIPAIAYVDRDSLRNDRAASLNHILQPPPKRRPSKPTASLYRTYLNRINPQDPARDPSVVALLFALAQSQRRKLGRARGSAAANPISFQVHVLLGDVLDDTRLWVYTADIPIAALDRLADFRCTPRGATHFTIHTTEIPFQPYTTLPERLLRATLPKVAQIFQAPPDRKRPRASDTSPAERMKIARVG